MAGFRENNYNYLSDSAVKEKWTKDSHCHFCRRRCDSQFDLKHHLQQENQEQCKECYFRHYKTKVSCLCLSSPITLLFYLLKDCICLFCSVMS